MTQYQMTMKKLQKDEAIKRLEWLNVNPEVLEAFRERDEIYGAVSFADVLFGMPVAHYRELIRDFEGRHNALVYHCELSEMPFGKCLSLLFVSQYPEEWEGDRYDLLYPKRGGVFFVYAYVENLDYPEYSELGKIGIVSHDGVIQRVY